MKFSKKHLLLIIVDVSASTGAFVGTVCLIAVRRSVSGEQDVVDIGEFQLSHIYDILFAPKLNDEQRLDKPFRRRLQSKPKRQR